MRLPFGADNKATSRIQDDAFELAQPISTLYRPEFGQQPQFTVVLGGATAAILPGIGYESVGAVTSLRAVLATPRVYMTDRIESASSFRTLRMVYMLLDEDYRPHVASVRPRLRISFDESDITEVTCNATKPSAAHHTCSLSLDQGFFSENSRNGSVSLILDSFTHTESFQLQSTPPWTADYCLGLTRSTCGLSPSFLYARAPIGPVKRLSDFNVQVHLHHTSSSGVVHFRFQFDPTLVLFVGTKMTGSPYSTIQLSDPLVGDGTSFSISYDALVSPANLDDTFPPSSSSTLVCTLTFRALSSGDAFRMYVNQVLGFGESSLIDFGEAFSEIDVLGHTITLLPEAAVVGILAAMTTTVTNLFPLSGNATTYAPYAISVLSEYVGTNTTSKFRLANV